MNKPLYWIELNRVKLFYKKKTKLVLNSLLVCYLKFGCIKPGMNNVLPFSDYIEIVSAPLGCTLLTN